ncbi:SIT4 phosphatase-associated protein [Cordyceps javanica]|uniref:SIT4 phosphatase-associated protein n=1 Tax=Cordyceps javanica TaxID=43265 RepID=A0A545V051_9HYPO|nr:SIT4 phosphatase-associated protein [Cordyceps javanica]TQW05698.1 SIT4 phosphatase-associated protein [Cordyceps javanica]
MFWRFGGYANISTIDTILDKTEFTLEELLDETDLIQELKQHNSKLIEYLREDAILKRLLEYVVAPRLESFQANQDNEDDLRGRNRLMTFSRPRASSRNTDSAAHDEQEEEKRRNRYALVACEILSSDTWSIYESLTDNKQLIRTFWGFLSRPAPLDPLQASYFTKVNESLFEKKTEDMIDLLRNLPDAVPDMLRHVECPMVMDLLLKIIAMDRTEGGHGIVEWLYSKDIISTLLSFISPEHSWVVQTAAGDFIKAIITISANASQNEQQCIGPNELTRQLVSKECVQQLIGYMLHGGNPLTVGVGIIIEVIRKNNSDYDPDVLAEAENEPSSRDPIYLGTLLRLFADNVPNFMSLIMEGPAQANGLASTFGEKLEPLGFDRFKTCELMAELLHCSNMGLLNEGGSEQLIAARDLERQRMRDAGLLFSAHEEETSSEHLTMRQGMPGEGRRLEVTNPNEDGFEEVDAATEEAQRQEKPSIVELREDDEFVDEPLTSPKLDATQVTEPQYENPELVVAPLSPSKTLSAELTKPENSSTSSKPDVPAVAEDLATKDDEETNAEEAAAAVDSMTRDAGKLDVASPSDGMSLVRELSPHPEDTPAPLFSAPSAPEPPTDHDGLSWDDMKQGVEPSEIIIAHVPEAPTAPELDMPGEPVVGDYLKQQFVEHRVVPAILSFFFKYPWNNFLHNVVYDVVQQVFNGPMDRGYNPTLAVSLFEAADITTAIIEGQQASDESQAKTKTRMGYMGHLTLIAEEVVKFTERHPPELLSETVLDKVMSAGWINYVEGALAETRERDNAILGGVRPEVALGHRASIGPGGIGGLTGLSNTPAGATALAEAGLNGGMELSDNNGGGIGPFAISGGTLISGFGSSSDEDDDDGEAEDEDVNTEFRSYAEQGGSLEPPSILPPPPPPPPLNIPPSRARLQLAARLAMHQKSSQDNAAFGGSYNGFDDEEDDDDDNDGRNATDPFADVDDDDLDDDDMDEDEPHRGGRGAWWRGVVSRAPGGTGDDDSDDEEFGDFAMAEDEKGGSDSGGKGAEDDETTPDRVLLKPLAVNPVKEAARGLSGLWPFGSRAEATTSDKAKPNDDDEGEVVVASAAEGNRSTGPVEAKEGIRRTSIEEVDDDEVLNFK